MQSHCVLFTHTHKEFKKDWQHAKVFTPTHTWTQKLVKYRPHHIQKASRNTHERAQTTVQLSS